MKKVLTLILVLVLILAAFPQTAQATALTSLRRKEPPMFDLKESDLPELERLAADGWNWLSRDKDNWIAVSKNEPQWSMWGYDHNGEYKWIGTWESETLLFVSPESKANIADAIAQIKAMKKPLTVNDRINQMTVEEKAAEADGQGLCVAEVFDGLCRTPARRGSECLSMTCKECWERVLTSPYKEATDD